MEENGEEMEEMREELKEEGKKLQEGEEEMTRKSVPGGKRRWFEMGWKK